MRSIAYRSNLITNSYEEEIDASIRLEPGVITLYGVAEKDNPEHVTLFETYADSSQYRSHLATPHFQKYKQGTVQMVKHLDLIQMQPILYHRKPELSNARPEGIVATLPLFTPSLTSAEIRSVQFICGKWRSRRIC